MYKKIIKKNPAHSTIQKKKEIIKLCNNVIKMINCDLKLTCKALFKTIVSNNETIEKFQNYNIQFKDAIIKYHKEYINKNKVDDVAFLNALQLSDMRGPAFKTILQEQLNSLKSDAQLSKELIPNKPNTSAQNNVAPTHVHYPTTTRIITVSGKPTESPFNINMNTSAASQLMKIEPNTSAQNNVAPTHLQYPTTTRIITVSGKPNESPAVVNLNISSASNTTLLGQEVPLRCKKNHHYKKDKIFNHICRICCKKDTINPMLKCEDCGLYTHTCCLNSDSKNCFLICVPLPKINLKMSSSKTIDLKELCVPHCRPMVPNLLLAIMHHVQTFKLTTENIYTTEVKDKKVVKELCNHLLEGSQKYLLKSNVRVVSDAFLMFLGSLKNPLLTYVVWKKLSKHMNEEKVVNWNTVKDCLSELPTENLDTLVYVLLHLKIMSRNTESKLTVEQLARFFTPLIAVTNFDFKTTKVVKMLIDMEEDFYFQFFQLEHIFFQSYFSIIPRRSITN